MHVLLVALNAKYVHTNLAVRYLRERVKSEFPMTEIREFTINEPVEKIAEEIYSLKADVIGFSCYIWNIRETLELMRRLRPVCPSTHFVLGGPEVSFFPTELMANQKEIDVVVIGEGENSFPNILHTWAAGQQDLSGVAGIGWREKDGRICVNQADPVMLDMDELPLPYGQEENLQNRLVYVETSRGCPFRCAYCLSSVTEGVRFLSPEKFRVTLRTLIKYGARTIKFVDRTFNARKSHAMAILEIAREESLLLGEDDGLRVHCEFAGELLDQEWMEYLRTYPSGLLQLEIGVQSTHRETLAAIKRPQHFDGWSGYVRELKQEGHIPIHLDLIAGLPGEDWQAFRKSFNDVYAVQPDMLQLGFLKMLKGSALRQNSAQYGLVFAPDPPYKILQTSCLSHGELIQLARIERLVDRYYNSGKFSVSLPAIISHFASPYDFFDKMASYWHKNEWFRQAWQGKALYTKLWDFLEDLNRSELTWEKGIMQEWREVLRFDFYLWEKPGSVPSFLLPLGEKETGRKEREEEIRFHSQWESRIAPYSELDRRQWARATAVECFDFDVLAEDRIKGKTWYLFFYRGETRVLRFEKHWGEMRDDQGQMCCKIPENGEI